MSELIFLEWKNVNLDTKRIAAVRTKSHKLRVIPISKDSRERLKRLPKLSRYVFVKEDGTTWKRDNLWTKFKAACERAGLPPDFTFHDLRHTFARDLLDRSVDIYTVSKLLGHSVLTTTQRYLSHNMPRAEEAVEALDVVACGGLLSPRPASSASRARSDGAKAP